MQNLKKIRVEMNAAQAALRSFPNALKHTMQLRNPILELRLAIRGAGLIAGRRKSKTVI